MKYKILFFGEENSMKLTKEQFIEIKKYIKANPKARFIEVNGDMLNVSSIKSIISQGQEKLTTLPEPKTKPVPKELMEKIRLQMNQKEENGKCLCKNYILCSIHKL